MSVVVVVVDALLPWKLWLVVVLWWQVEGVWDKVVGYERRLLFNKLSLSKCIGLCVTSLCCTYLEMEEVLEKFFTKVHPK